MKDAKPLPEAEKKKPANNIIKKNKEAAALKAAAVAKKPGTATVRKADGGSLSINKQGPDYTIADGKMNMFSSNVSKIN